MRTRLLLGAAITIFAALAVSWAAMTWMFERHIERRVEEELTRYALELVTRLSVDGQGTPAVDDSPLDPRFEDPASGFYWQISTTADAVRSRSLWDGNLQPVVPAPADHWRLRTAPGPYEHRVLVLERRVRPERTGPEVLVQVAQDRRAVHTAGSEFALELALFLGSLWLVLSAAAWLQVHLGLRPLARVRREVEALRKSAAARIPQMELREIEPLAEAVNSLADAREADLISARRRAADLAHGLKTPIAALSAQSRRAREAGAIEAADGLDRAVAAAWAVVESELARARVAAIDRSAARSGCVPLDIVERIVGVVERTDFGASVVFDVQIPPLLRVPVSAHDFNEIAGPLIENAARFARRRVLIRGEAADAVSLRFEDDGPGLGTARPEHVLVRGGRLDESSGGHGLGLAISADLVTATGGRMELRTSPLGGLAVVITWSRLPS